MAGQGGGTATVTVHSRICPQDYDGSDFYEECHDTAPDPGLPYTLSNGDTLDETTDAEGNILFDGLAVGTYSLTGGAPGEFTDTHIFCALEADLGEPIASVPVTGGVQFDLADGQNVICDWFIIPLGQNGQPPTPTAPPADGGTLTVYKATCPEGYQGTNHFEDCFENATSGVEFAIGTTATDNVASATTGPDGFVTFDLDPFLLGEGSTITFGELTTVGGADPVVVCTRNDGAEAVEIIDVTTIGFEGRGPAYAVTIAPEPDDQVRCDWYNIPPAQETPTPAPPAPTATPDPNARPAAIREGDCDEAVGDVVVDLTGLSQPEGETVGQDDAILAATSFTVIDLSLDQILAADHVIIIGEPAGAAIDEPVVCGEIGGVLDANGDLVIGLAERDDSGYTGIAFFSPDPTDANQTQISVFIAGVLDEDLQLTPAA
jgi:hypothetical protein